MVSAVRRCSVRRGDIGLRRSDELVTSAPVTTSRLTRRCRGKSDGDGAHPADRHIPVPSSVADHVVQETAIRGESAPCAEANVPISPSVNTTPRTRSWVNDDR